MKKLRFLLAGLVIILGVCLRPLLAQTDLMQDVDAVKENNDSDLYAPDDDSPSEAKKDSTAQSSPAEKVTEPSADTGTDSTANVEPAPSTNAAPQTAEAPARKAAPSLDDLPVNTPTRATPPMLDNLPVSGAAPSAPTQRFAQRPSTAETGTDEVPPAELSAIRIYTMSDRTRFEIQTNKVVDYAPEQTANSKEFILKLGNTRIGPLVSSAPINARDYGGPVTQVQALESDSPSGSMAQVVMNLTSKVSPTIRREGTRILVDFMGKTPLTNSSGRRILSADLPSFETLISLDGSEKFTGTKVNFKAKDAAVPDVLQFLSQVSGKNFVLAGESDKKISLNVKNIPWDQVLALVLLNSDLGYQKVGNTYRVMPVTKIRQEISDTIKAKDDQDRAASKATELFPLSYAKTTDVLANIQKFLKPELNESIVADDRTNSVVVTALPKNIQRVRRYIEEIDKQTPVVQVEARIVIAKKDFSRELGINWQTLLGGSSKFGNATFGHLVGDKFDPTIPINQGVLGANGGLFGRFIGGPGAAIQGLDALLKFTESNKMTHEISRPSLTVLNNKKANIIDGTQYTLVIPAPTGSTGAPTVTTIEANLSLAVTPQVTNDNNVIMAINLTKDTFGEAITITNSGAVPKDKREINTETLVESGSTVVIGGVYVKTEGSTVEGWPFLSKIPILGGLFVNNNAKTDNEHELLMFISPRILNVDKASVHQQSLEEAR